MRDSYDIIIVGAGSAGCVLANRLTAQSSRRVLLLESGGNDNSILIHMPLGIGKMMTPGSPKYWEYTASQGPGRSDEPWVKGKTLGGSSSVNGMVYVRGAPEDYDEWEAAGCTGWGWETIRRCFQDMEDHALGEGEGRGVGGPLKITMPMGGDPLADAVLEAGRQTGVRTVKDLNSREATTNGGYGFQPCTIHKGRRYSASKAFLETAKDRPNLDIVTNAEVQRLVFEGTRVTGVQIAVHGSKKVINATDQVILCAGAINSPKILQLSGIGPAPLLRKHGIEVIAHSPDVGKNVREHRVIQFAYRLTSGGFNTHLHGLGLVRSVVQYFAGGHSILSKSVVELCGLIKSSDDLTRTDCQIGVLLYTFAGAHEEERHRSASEISRQPGMMFAGCFLRPESCGETHIVSSDPAAKPFINANYLTADIDRQRTIRLFKEIRRLAAQPALAPFIISESMPGNAVGDDDDAIIEASFKYGTPGFHVSGSCRMGADSGSVVDPQLRVRGVQGLRVVDTSIMPTMVSGNTNGPVMAMAWNAADIIARESNR